MFYINLKKCFCTSCIFKNVTAPSLIAAGHLLICPVCFSGFFQNCQSPPEIFGQCGKVRTLNFIVPHFTGYVIID